MANSIQNNVMTNKFKRLIILMVLLLYCVIEGRKFQIHGKRKHTKNYGDFTKSNSNLSFDLSTCCTLAFGSCQTICDNLLLIDLQYKNNSDIFMEITDNCPNSMNDFWICMNKTFQYIEQGMEWSGRKCCNLGFLPKCQNVCQTSSGVGGLAPSCRRTVEYPLYACVERQRQSDICCANAKSNECMQLCQDIFDRRMSLTKEYYDTDVDAVCDERSGNIKVLECIKNHTDLTPFSDAKKYLHCCQQTTSKKCSINCKNVLNLSDVTGEMIINTLEQGGCGSPLPHDQLWQCLMLPNASDFLPTETNGVSRVNQIGIDAAKLHCCLKAISPKCRTLCQQFYYNNSTATKGEFHSICSLQLNELNLLQCMAEVDASCDLGCGSLSFCTNFNNRPLELFRACNNGTDEAARDDFDRWQHIGLLNVQGLTLPLRNISQCFPEFWHAFACILHIQPCTLNLHLNYICKDDCFNLFTKCVDWAKLQKEITPSSVCSKFSSEDNTAPCISLRAYVEPSNFSTDINSGLTSPCQRHHCKITEICAPYRNGTIGYECLSSCSVGRRSKHRVPYGALVRVAASNLEPDCFKICECGNKGKLTSCQPMPCYSFSQCLVGNRIIDHASWFYVACNICSCFAGEVTCTKKQCRFAGSTDQYYTSLPCNCTSNYDPVCSKNGKTFPSACIGKCLGFTETDIESGTCEQQDPCKEDMHDCPSDTVCFADRQVCLSSIQRQCHQYRCEPMKTPCNTTQPVCDIHGVTYPSICHFISTGSVLLHFGRCFKGCGSSAPICGINGVTYKNECEAWSDFSWMDYEGVCQEVGLIGSNLKSYCKNIECRPLPSVHCVALVPPGACCPICSDALQIIYSRKQVDRALFTLKRTTMHFITLQRILQELDNILKLTECQLIGFLSIEAYIFVAVHSRELSPTKIQIEVCNAELNIIAYMINSQSHKITSNLALSTLTGAVKIGDIKTNGVIANTSQNLMLSLVCMCWIYFEVIF